MFVGDLHLNWVIKITSIETDSAKIYAIELYVINDTVSVNVVNLLISYTQTYNNISVNKTLHIKKI